MSDDDEVDEETKKGLQKPEFSTQLSKFLEIPLGAKATIQIAIDKENAKARIKNHSSRFDNQAWFVA